MSHRNQKIWREELISTLVLGGFLISLLIVLSLSSSSLMEAWQMTFSHVHDMGITMDEIRNLLIVSTMYLLIILGPIFLVIFLGDIFGSKKNDRSIRPRIKSVVSIFDTALIFVIFFSYIYFNFDHLIFLGSLSIEQIFSFILKMSVKIISIIVIIKVLIFSSLLFRSESKPH
jgi:flagellar biosynthesis protein FlhB